jgi:hypothetical protein
MIRFGFLYCDQICLILYEKTGESLGFTGLFSTEAMVLRHLLWVELGVELGMDDLVSLLEEAGRQWHPGQLHD